jgi:hypothetical protein
MPSDWIDHVNAPQTSAEVDAFKDAVNSGEPFGPEHWRETIRAVLGKEQRRKRGRPFRCDSQAVLFK